MLSKNERDCTKCVVLLQKECPLFTADAPRNSEEAGPSKAGIRFMAHGTQKKKNKMGLQAATPSEQSPGGA